MADSQTNSPASSTGVPRPTGSSPGNSGQNTLYLYTFLTTLSLLLVVSLTIVTRSIVIRQRYRRRIEAVLAANLLPTGKTCLPPKPEMPHVWIKNPIQEIDYWNDIKPVSATPALPYTPPPEVIAAASRPLPRSLTRTSRITLPFAPTPIPSSPLPEASESSTEQTLRVVVFVSMPNSHRRQLSVLDPSVKGKEKDLGEWDDDGELPELVFGVSEMSLPQPITP